MKKILPILFLLFLGLVLYSKEASAAGVAAIRICGTAVIPSLLPYLVLSRLLIGCISPPKNNKNSILHKLLGLSSGGSLCLLLSFLGGYPVGAATVAAQYEKGRITKQEAERLLCYCNNSGPGFFIGIIGSAVLNSIPLGLCLYLIHCLTAILLGTMFSPLQQSSVKLRRISAEQPCFSQVLQESITGACSAMLQICTLVILFFILTAVLDVALPSIPMPSILSPAEWQALSSGFLELTGGIVKLKGLPHGFPLCATLMGWGGFCVHLQAISLWTPPGLKPKHYFRSKLLHGLLSGVFALLLTYDITHCVLLYLLVFTITFFGRKIYTIRGRKKAKLAV